VRGSRGKRAAQQASGWEDRANFFQRGEGNGVPFGTVAEGFRVDDLRIMAWILPPTPISLSRSRSRSRSLSLCLEFAIGAEKHREQDRNRQTDASVGIRMYLLLDRILYASVYGRRAAFCTLPYAFSYSYLPCFHARFLLVFSTLPYTFRILHFLRFRIHSVS
jgi:hypothetical protein